jgi:hypothetical protein
MRTCPARGSPLTRELLRVRRPLRAHPQRPVRNAASDRRRGGVRRNRSQRHDGRRTRGFLLGPPTATQCLGARRSRGTGPHVCPAFTWHSASGSRRGVPTSPSYGATSIGALRQFPLRVGRYGVRMREGSLSAETLDAIELLDLVGVFGLDTVGADRRGRSNGGTSNGDRKPARGSRRDSV